MNKGKTKLTRQDAERLFEGLPPSNAKVSSRPENPFGPAASDVVKRVEALSAPFWMKRFQGAVRPQQPKS